MIRYTSIAALSLITLSAIGCAPQTAPRSANPLPFAEFKKIETAPDLDPTCMDESCAELRQEFRYVVYVGKQIYAYWDEKKAETGTDFDALAQSLEKSITDLTTPTQYYKTLRKWAAAFHDGHVNVMAKTGWTEAEVYSAPVRLELLSPGTDREKLIVAKINDTIGGGVIEGIQVGDEVLSVNGVPYKQALNEAEKEVSGSTSRMRRRGAASRLVDALGVENSTTPLALEISRGGKVSTVEIMRSAPLVERQNGTESKDDEETSGIDLLKVAILPGGLGYLRIDGFQGSQDQFLLDQAMDRLAETKGLLLDLRQNGGGDLSGNAILARLSKPGETITRYKTSVVLDHFLLSQRPQYFSRWVAGQRYSEWNDVSVGNKDVKPYKKPVVALTSAYCFSACDTFVAALKSNQLATIAGEATGGGTGTPLVFELPVTEHKFRYSVVRGKTSKDESIEGVGTLPDVLIEPTIEDRIARKDSQLLKAITLLQGSASEAGKSTTLSRAVSALPPVLDQDLRVPPTVEHERYLKRISVFDER